jgi:uncharacterized protein (DUF1499 family)
MSENIGWSRLSAACLVVLLTACGNNNVTTGIVDDRLTPCPDSPNCAIEAGERITIVTVDETYLHAEVRSAIFRFVDDTEFHLRASDGIIAIRSAARTGYGDLGVNRKRIEKIREVLRGRDLIE